LIGFIQHSYGRGGPILFGDSTVPSFIKWKKLRGFTLVELLVVIAIIGVLIGLLMPAVQKIRETANRMACSNNQKQLVLGCHNFHDSYGHWPLNGTQSFYVGLAPFVEQQNNLGANPEPVPIFVCPSRRAATQNYCDYAGFLPFQQLSGTVDSTYTNWNWTVTNYPGVLSCDLQGNDRPVKMTDITDGTSQTAVLTDKFISVTDYGGFVTQGDVAWNLPGQPNQSVDNYTWLDGNPPVYVGSNTKRDGAELARDSWGAQGWGSFYYRYQGSNHTAGIQPVGFADGSVRNYSWLPYGMVGFNDGIVIYDYNP
jgi:prepilin-type N-terminal cleavage/methylation domain-containing protein